MLIYTLTIMGTRSRFNRTRLRDLRTMKGLTTDDFARPIGVTRQTVANWETGKTSPTMQQLEKLCRVYDVDLASFLTSRKVAAKELAHAS